MPRPKKGDPEMLLVSFCDILTISISALFMAVIITVMEATKIPEFKPTPRAVPTNKSPAFFECRDQQVFYVDKDSLDTIVAERLSKINPGVRGGDLAPFLKAVSGEEIASRYYTVDPSYLLVGVMALNPRPDARGVKIEELNQPDGPYFSTLAALNHEQRYLAFLVRDDSFNVFREARRLGDQKRFESGWELLAIDEPIKFGATGTSIAPQ